MPDSRAQLVITVPDPYNADLAHRMRCRMTLGVLIQLLVEARRYVVIAAPFMQSGYGLSAGPLADALQFAVRRGVNIDIVGSGEGLQTIDMSWLGLDVQGVVRLFQPRANQADKQRLGSHAKFCVADGASAYIGSANLTGPGLGKQLEIGLLVEGSIAQQLEDLWFHTLDIGIFVPL